jgi:hypothetical protein
MTLISDIQPPAPKDRPLLEEGDKGSWVSTLQFLLYGCGYPTPIDRQFGPATRDTISKFQKNLGITESGVVDAKTWEALDNHGKLPSWKPMWSVAEGVNKKVDRKAFFNEFRVRFSRARINQTQVDGYDAIFDYWENSNLTDLRWLAYVLATAFHETGETIEPVREGFCKTDACSIRAVTRLFNDGKIGVNYSLPEANRNSYFGRGLVQITFGDNYKKLGQSIGIGTLLYDNPALALNLDISVTIMFKGMVDGLFTGKKLSDFFNDSTTDWFHARRIVNRLDKASLIEDYTRMFHICLQ